MRWLLLFLPLVFAAGCFYYGEYYITDEYGYPVHTHTAVIAAEPVEVVWPPCCWWTIWWPWSVSVEKHYYHHGLRPCPRTHPGRRILR